MKRIIAFSAGLTLLAACTKIDTTLADPEILEQKKQSQESTRFISAGTLDIGGGGAA